MKINYSQNTHFYGINIREGGEQFVHREGGESALSKLQLAKEKFNGGKWNLLIDSNGYTFESPQKKTYTGPFTVKRLFKTGEARNDTTKLVIRMDKANRKKFSVFIPGKANLDKWYKMIKTSQGLEKMLNILYVLETSFR